MFLPFSQVSGRLSALWRKLFGRVVNTAFDVGIGWFWEVLFAHLANLSQHSVEDFPFGMSEKRFIFLIISWHWAKNFRIFVKNVEAGMPELHSTCLQEHFERFIFLEKFLNFFFLLRTLSEKFRLFVNFFNGAVNSVFYVSIGTIRWKIFSKKIENIWVFNFFRTLIRKRIGFPASLFRPGWRNCILRLYKNIFRRIFWKKNFSVIFWQRA